MLNNPNYNARSSRVILQHHDARVCDSDLRILDDPTSWLNDACVHFGLVRLQDKCKYRCEEDDSGVAPAHPSSSGLPSSTFPSAFFVDPAVVSFLSHQCEDEEEMIDLYRGLWQSANNNNNCDINIDNDAADSEATSDSRCSFYFLPINDDNASSRDMFGRPGGGNHWSLLLVVSVVASQTANKCRDGRGAENSSSAAISHLLCLHFDSSRGSNALAARTVATKFREVLLVAGVVGGAPSASDDSISAASVVVVECRTPQQGNGYDCGLYALAVAEALSSDLPSLRRVMLRGSDRYASDDVGVGHDDGGGLVRRAFVQRCEGAVNAALSRGDFAPALRRRMAEDVRNLAAAAAAAAAASTSTGDRRELNG